MNDTGVFVLPGLATVLPGSIELGAGILPAPATTPAGTSDGFIGTVEQLSCLIYSKT